VSRGDGEAEESAISGAKKLGIHGGFFARSGLTGYPSPNPLPLKGRGLFLLVKEHQQDALAFNELHRAEIRHDWHRASRFLS
jgi:hypothetical protein